MQQIMFVHCSMQFKEVDLYIVMVVVQVKLKYEPKLFITNNRKALGQGVNTKIYSFVIIQ
jgi:hypothetical protein